jgi:hypothetical protein
VLLPLNSGSLLLLLLLLVAHPTGFINCVLQQPIQPTLHGSSTGTHQDHVLKLHVFGAGLPPHWLLLLLLLPQVVVQLVLSQIAHVYCCCCCCISASEEVSSSRLQKWPTCRTRPHRCQSCCCHVLPLPIV